MPHNSDYSLIWRDTTNHLALMHEEIALALGRPTTTMVGQLCADIDNNGNRVNKINKWAKYKPVRLYMDWLADDNPNWWKADGMCGIDATNFVFDSFSQFVSRLIQGFSSGDYLDWKYAPPRGMRVNNEPLRPLDFNYYHKDAINPGGNIQTGRRDIYNGQTSVLLYFPTIPLPLYNLQVGDFTLTIPGIGQDASFNDCYAGVILFNASNRNRWAAGTFTDNYGNPVKIGSMSTGLNYTIRIEGADTILNGTDVDTPVDVLPIISTLPLSQTYFPHGVTSANVDELEMSGDPDTGEMLEGAWISGFGRTPISVTIHRYGMYNFGLDSDLEWNGVYVTGMIYFGAPTEYEQITVNNVHFGICKGSDIQAYRAGTIDRATLEGRSIEATYAYSGTFVGSTGTQFTLESLTPGNQGLYAPEGTDPDEYDPSEDYYLVAFPSTAQSYNAIISATKVDDVH